MSVLIRPWGHMHVLDEGPERAPAILFANSLGTDLRMWDAVVRRLPGYRCIRFDKRGHGLSATPQQATPQQDGLAAGWTVQDLAADAVALLDHLGIARATIAGCSVGGMVAQALALDHPDRARALILSNTAAKIGTAEGWQARITAVETAGIAAIADMILERWFPKAFCQSPEALIWRSMLLRADPVGYVQTCRALAQADLRAGLGGLQLPVMVLGGSEDQSTPPDLVAETAAMIPAAQLTMMQGSGHIPAIDAPEATARIITAFMETLDV